jgi:hypothetical protein
MVVSDATRGDVSDAGLAQRCQSGIGDLTLVTDADASLAGCKFNIGFGYRSTCDDWNDATSKCHLSRQHGLVRIASVDGDAHLWAGGSRFAPCARVLGEGRRRS